MRKNTPKFFQKMQNITQNAGKIRSVAMATNMATIFWTGKLVFYDSLYIVGRKHNACHQKFH